MNCLRSAAGGGVKFEHFQVFSVEKNFYFAKWTLSNLFDNLDGIILEQTKLWQCNLWLKKKKSGTKTLNDHIEA